MDSVALAQREKRVLWFIALSVLLHLTVMTILSRPWPFTISSPKDDSVAIEVVPLSKQEIDRIKGQIVETAKVEKTEKAAKDAFLGEQTQVVTEQTKAKTNAPFRDGRAGGARGKSERVRLGDLGVHMDFKPMGSLGPGETAATNDYLRDVKPGAQTLLNTKEYAFFSFYQRVRRQLEQFWEPGLRQRLKQMADRGRALAAEQEHSTKLLVVLNGEGTITRIQVEGTSGLLDLDQAAVDAFNRAGPFPNPPSGMIERDGTVKVEWEFILKT